MKKISTVLLCMSLILCTGCAASNAETVSHMQNTITNAYDLFLNNLPLDKSGQCIYPDTYAGAYIEDGIIVFLITTADHSEYQYLQDAFPSVRFKQVEYSMNYLQSLIDEYMASYDSSSETVYGAWVDERLNRAVIKIDEKSLSSKSIVSDYSPLIFELGSYAVNLNDSEGLK